MTFRIAILTLAVAVAGCSGGAAGKKEYADGGTVGLTPSQASKSPLIQPDCYTVDPYVPPRIAKPRKDVPDPWRQFSGKWGGGAWDGRVCHDLYVLQVEPSGTVVMFDAHGPGFNADATAFTRKGVIGSDGRLRVRKGNAQVEYWIEDGRMYGLRRRGRAENRIIMTRQKL